MVDNQKTISLHFEHRPKILQLVELNQYISFDQTKQVYYLYNCKKNIKMLYKYFRGKAWINGEYFFNSYKNVANNQPFEKSAINTKTSPLQKEIPDSYINKLQLKRYALNTSRIYCSMFGKYINYYIEREIDELDENDIREYLSYLIRQGKSPSFQNQMINAIKFYYEVVLNMPRRFYHLERPRKEKPLPKVLSVEEVTTMINSTTNRKHRCILILLYSGGLRRSELLQLKPTDIESNRMLIRIESSKGKRDRYTVLSPMALKELRHYYREYRPEHYLFEGKKANKYSETSVINIVKAAAKRAGIQRNITPHMLRHSFATHMLDRGINLRHIQNLMGHESTKTTEIYTHVSISSLQGVKSPLDFLNLAHI